MEPDFSAWIGRTEQVEDPLAVVQAQAAQVAERLAGAGMATPADREIVALIAYLQGLGTNLKAGN